MKAITLTTFDHIGSWSADLPLRLFLAWEFFESGWEKFNGSNWFADLQTRFPFPFNLLPVELNWQLSMWAELVLPLLLLLGLGTRLASFGLMVVTVVAIAALGGDLEQGLALLQGMREAGIIVGTV